MTILALLGNIWVRRAIVVVVVLIALFMVRQHYIDLGKTEGKQQAVQTDAVDTAKQQSVDRDASAQRIAELQNQINSFEVRAASDRALFLALSGQRQMAATQVAGMTEDQ